MTASTGRTSQALLLLFVLSGFSGLVYQSVWSHYLGLTLGHAAYAQSLVLAIFMGGMAGGAWLASRLSLRWRHLILAYAWLEIAIGLAGLLFHPAFDAYLRLSTQVVLPGIDSPGLAHAYQWSSAALLIAPQCVLLGATFPILSAGYMRLAPQQSGQILGGLYFSNSLGAAAGALATAFVLLPAVGMPGSVATAAVINLVVGLGAWILWRRTRAHAADREGEAASREPRQDRSFPRVMLVAAGITGASSFVYEIGWVRLLNQALGTTVHSFELMLAAFILGLAFGGLWVRRRGALRTDVVATAGYAQVFMGIAALLSIPLFNQSFRWVAWLMQHLARDDAGYAWFTAGSGAIAMAVMFPAAFFAGMTLPLFTLALLRRGWGEASIGRVYAANTLGAIVGVFLALHLLVPLLGVRLAITLAAIADLVLGLYLLRVVAGLPSRRGYAMAGAGAAVACMASLWLGMPNPQVQAAGVFRTGEWRLDDGVRVPYFKDGKTATVSIAVDASGAYANIATNGKPDAHLAVDTRLVPAADEVTMLMAGALPLALHGDPRRIAVIGWGSGLTTHTLLGSSVPRQVDSIEIERAMYDAARLFGPRVERAYSDPRSRVVIDDARTYFATGNRRYDVIVSEPSNPWVSGVASLFTREFYGFVRDHLEPGGMLVQWVQAYELNDALLGTMVAALLEEFPHAEAYVTNQHDVLIVGWRDAPVAPHWARLAEAPLHGELQRVGLGTPEEFAVRRIGGAATLRNYVRVGGAQPHSDYYPTVSLEAPRARFKSEMADLLLQLPSNGIPIQEMLGERIPPAEGADISDERYSFASEAHHRALEMRATLASGRVTPRLRERWPLYADAAQVVLANRATDLREWSGALATASSAVTGLLPRAAVAGLYDGEEWTPGTAPARDLLSLHAATARRDAADMLARAQAVLESRASYSNEAREQALVIGMLGGIASGRPGSADALERRFGPGIPPSLLYGRLRSWLLAWEDGET